VAALGFEWWIVAYGGLVLWTIFVLGFGLAKFRAKEIAKS
jgi:hypothetical protein